MYLTFRSTASDSNPWQEQDRREHRKLLATALVFTGAVTFGFGLLIYALIAA
jgi:hypothetical protein